MARPIFAHPFSRPFWEDFGSLGGGVKNSFMGIIKINLVKQILDVCTLGQRMTNLYMFARVARFPQTYLSHDCLSVLTTLKPRRISAPGQNSIFGIWAGGAVVARIGISAKFPI